MIYKTRVIDISTDKLSASLKEKMKLLREELQKAENYYQDIKKLESSIFSTEMKLGGLAAKMTPDISESDFNNLDKRLTGLYKTLELKEAELKRLVKANEKFVSLMKNVEKVKRVMNEVIKKDAKKSGLSNYEQYSSNQKKYDLPEK